MFMRNLARILLVPLLTGFVATADAANSKPNVLFIISDDLNNFLGAYGDPRAKTPNLDKLAARGVRFDRAYCTFPLCGPSRNSMLTGLYPNTTGILRNAEIFRQTIPSHVSLPQAFRQHGYFAARLGKLYHYGVPRSIGTDGHDDPGSWELELNPVGVDRLEEEPQIFTLTPGQFGGTLSWHASPKSDRFHTDGLLASDAEWVLERCAKQKDRPFFLAVGFFRPHTPYVSPQPYFGLYRRQDMPVFPPVETFRTPELPAAALGSAKKEQAKLTDELRRECVQAYYASISFMDAHVGRVIAALDRLGLADNTIIVFTSDHGYHMGEHGLWQKMSLFEESARVPLLIVAPGVTKPGTVAKSPVSQVDLYPTLAELCGVKTPANLHGQSLVPMLANPSAAGRGWALTQVTRGNRFFGYTLRTARWRYTEWDEGNRGRELYDHDADPREQKNLAAIAAHAETVSALSLHLRAAVKASFPPDGQTPEIKPGLWMPNLTNP
jgi:iduronate 2-sulfatase